MPDDGKKSLPVWLVRIRSVLLLIVGSCFQPLSLMIATVKIGAAPRARRLDGFVLY
jgi:hypothetical protein